MMKKVNKKYVPVRLEQCPRCKFAVRQTLFDYDNAIYKCTKCGNIHA